eukprot:Blabericola_migrator_1__229@NODE_1060_length_5561_cov_32_202767_g104_i4_p5_GENE_NODE_1060_length_5561_cov_32_202767_g104_i4NODE_1060_length_5561_cov_32_202767_g104_i4_p5_ORF_typecomplete_len158_score21_23_NODE_1060_length_5561_cov_32_202767_g104_i448975370
MDYEHSPPVISAVPHTLDYYLHNAEVTSHDESASITEPENRLASGAVATAATTTEQSTASAGSSAAKEQRIRSDGETSLSSGRSLGSQSSSSWSRIMSKLRAAAPTSEGLLNLSRGRERSGTSQSNLWHARLKTTESSGGQYSILGGLPDPSDGVTW